LDRLEEVLLLAIELTRVVERLHVCLGDLDEDVHELLHHLLLAVHPLSDTLGVLLLLLRLEELATDFLELNRSLSVCLCGELADKPLSLHEGFKRNEAIGTDLKLAALFGLGFESLLEIVIEH